MHNVIKGCLEVLSQGEKYLNTIDKKDYTAIVKPYFISAPGEHIRHILDMFLAVRNSGDNNTIDYDQRQRGSEIETSPELALQQFTIIKAWIESLQSIDLEQKVKVKTEVSIIDKKVAEITTTLGRELIFCAGHTVHHFSIIAIAAQMQNAEIDSGFGVAPATATYLRETGDQCAH